MSFKTLSLSDCKTDKQVICHSIPCNVKSDCKEAKIDTYFEPTIRSSDKDNSVLLSSLRGRPLVGRHIDLPENCCAFTVNHKNDKELVANESFGRITHWNLDKTSSDSDSLPQIIQWIQISNAIHSSPVCQLSDKN
ncbi:uncharacterized protein LOC128953634 [Oppia nitens]|uniref:uncharacterized protein LOC128953634 n=1 Tax=Oppia nitens TaxID=1686743 RepID=UPI0023DC55DC|nr:uncharacterized protein LOC128953634 [Oppia nitens]